ncbi:uncharacterized protein B0H18DRAFT_983329 [Fomitopsis serialis]|uniref:uncharacterized protein n=1 Tax=Fomitopsis serialis TaxID=139415 RepID=UPI002008009F|nr:uncharacterized protein B0H18DRAFT_983329 [Neoantrodia serialis]KAH9933367.1 hypothetical protein B0H18DRAFT_983329 [Neoantrodia serialis]
MPSEKHWQQSSLFDALQAEFSPPLDSSLIAAIIADYDLSTANDQIQPLRDVLSQLAAQAEKELVDEDILSEQLSNVQISSYSITDDTTSSHDLFSPQSSNTASSSTSDSSSQHSFTAFPHVPTSKLRSALSNADDTESLDMESVVEGLLSSEYVRELEERGLDGLEGEEIDEADWITVDGKRKKPKQKRGTTFTLVDIRQKQHERPSPASPRAAPPDPWTQLSSVALCLPLSRISSPAKALPSSSQSEPDMHSEHTSMLFAMFDVLRASPEYVELKVEERDQVMEDGQLALKATHGQPDRAIDLVWLLRELEHDSTSGEYDWGVYHSPAPARLPRPERRQSRSVQLPTGPPPSALPHAGAPPRPSATSRSATRRRPECLEDHPAAAAHGAAPARGVHPCVPQEVRGSGNGLGKGGKGDVGELAVKWNHTRRARGLMAERQEMLRKAGRAWQTGNAKTHGGRARELQQQARKEQLDAAREMVQAKRETPADITGRGMHSRTASASGSAVRSALEEDGWVVRKYDGGLVISGRNAWRS